MKIKTFFISIVVTFVPFSSYSFETYTSPYISSHYFTYDNIEDSGLTAGIVSNANIYNNFGISVRAQATESLLDDSPKRLRIYSKAYIHKPTLGAFKLNMGHHQNILTDRDTNQLNELGFDAVIYYQDIDIRSGSSQAVSSGDKFSISNFSDPNLLVTWYTNNRLSLELHRGNNFYGVKAYHIPNILKKKITIASHYYRNFNSHDTIILSLTYNFGKFYSLKSTNREKFI